MSDELLQIAIDYGVMRLGCEKALALLTDPDASEFDAEKVIAFLESILKEKTT